MIIRDPKTGGYKKARRSPAKRVKILDGFVVGSGKKKDWNRATIPSETCTYPTLKEAVGMLKSQRRGYLWGLSGGKRTHTLDWFTLERILNVREGRPANAAFPKLGKSELKWDEMLKEMGE